MCRLRRSTSARAVGGQGGFTLLELLVVVAVLGVLAGVAVVATGALTDAGQEQACATDERTLVTAMEAHAATTGVYGDEAALVSAGYLASASTLHDVVLSGDGYVVVTVGECSVEPSAVAMAADVVQAPDTTTTTTTAPIATMSVSSIVSVKAVNVNTNQWRATALVQVSDDLNQPVSGAAVTLNVQRQGLNGTWSDLASVSGITDGAGSLTVSSAVVNKYPVPRIRFRTASVSAEGLEWQPNSDWSEVRRP
ncbi:MAG: prepilin-type N-terminal cleavage/methylation domain-containing protein [Microthrixaceae bacterium]